MFVSTCTDMSELLFVPFRSKPVLERWLHLLWDVMFTDAIQSVWGVWKGRRLVSGTKVANHVTPRGQKNALHVSQPFKVHRHPSFKHHRALFRCVVSRSTSFICSSLPSLRVRTLVKIYITPISVLKPHRSYHPPHNSYHGASTHKPHPSASSPNTRRVQTPLRFHQRLRPQLHVKI